MTLEFFRLFMLIGLVWIPIFFLRRYMVYSMYLLLSVTCGLAILVGSAAIILLDNPSDAVTIWFGFWIIALIIGKIVQTLYERNRLRHQDSEVS